MTVYEKLMKVQSVLKAPKNQHNSFGNYNYRSCEDIQEAAKPILSANKCVCYISDEIQIVGDRCYVKATATFCDVESGEKIVVSACARESLDKKGMDQAQVTGAASSYARKYALAGLYQLDDTNDADIMNNDSKEITTKTELSKEQIEFLEKLPAQWQTWAIAQDGVKEIKYCSAKTYNTIIAAINSKKNGTSNQ